MATRGTDASDGAVGPDARACFTGLADQFARTWCMFNQAVSRFPEDRWYEETISGMAPARRAYHLVYWADVYQRRARTEVTGVPDPDDPDVARLPDRAALLPYANDVSARLDRLLRESSPRKLPAPYRTRRTGANLFERLLYVLRHNMQHIGERHAMLRHLDLEPAEWR
ncbi:MAG: DinB family protein [Armatimonadetes bacterium]|nr:DinB family protein [Armatimonadota bacterium]